MAVWGIGAYYKGSSPEDKTKDFLNDSCVYISWNETKVPILQVFHQIMHKDQMW